MALKCNKKNIDSEITRLTNMLSYSKLDDDETKYIQNMINDLENKKYTKV